MRLIKKKIDLNARPKKEEEVPVESAGEKYKEETEVTQHQFDVAAVRSTVLADTDTCTERLMKKICEFNVLFNPLLLALPLNFILGRSMAFSVSMFFLSIVCCFLFNVFKVHRACIELKYGRQFFEILWILLSTLMLLNLWTTSPSSMLYLLK